MRKSLKFSTSTSPFGSGSIYSGGAISGIVKENGYAVANRLVRVHERDSGLVVGQGLSREDGYFFIPGLDTNSKNYYVVAFNDNVEIVFNAIVFDKVDPFDDPDFALDDYASIIRGLNPKGFWRNSHPFLKKGIFFDFGSFRQDAVINTQNFPNTSSAWVSKPFSDRRMGFELSEGSFVELPDLFYNNMEEGFCFELFVRISSVGNNQKLIEATNQFSAGPSLNSFLDDVFLGRVGVTDDIVFSVYNGNDLVGSIASTSDDVLTVNETMHIAVISDFTGAINIYKNGSSVASGTIIIPNIPRKFTHLGLSSQAGDSFLGGTISDFAFYDTTLSSSVLVNHYNEM
jgi:Concanavalin A-like lectin/glucanases superfamily